MRRKACWRGYWVRPGDSSLMTEEIAATPGWVDDRLNADLASIPAAALAAYAECPARAKQPGAPSDKLGAEFNHCRATLRHALPHAE